MGPKHTKPHHIAQMSHDNSLALTEDPKPKERSFIVTASQPAPGYDKVLYTGQDNHYGNMTIKANRFCKDPRTNLMRVCAPKPEKCYIHQKLDQDLNDQLGDIIDDNMKEISCGAMKPGTVLETTVDNMKFIYEDFGDQIAPILGMDGSPDPKKIEEVQKQKDEMAKQLADTFIILL